MLPDSALLTRAHKKRKVTKAGLMTVKVPLSKRVSSKLRERGFKGQRAAVAVSTSHRKDTKKGGAKHEIAQVSVGQLVKGKWSKRKIQRATAAATEQLRASTRSGSHLRGNIWRDLGVNAGHAVLQPHLRPEQLPFQQQITFQPVIECMYAANYQASGNPAPPPASQQTVPAGGQAVLLRAVARLPAGRGLPARPVRRRERSQRPRDSGNADH